MDGISEEDVQWGWTEIQQFAAEMKRWLNNFPHKQYRRCRFMLLEPDGHITGHQLGSKIILVAEILNPPYQSCNHTTRGCYLKKEQIRKKNYLLNLVQAYWFDNGVEHEAYNGSKENRFHFIVHGGDNQEGDLMLYEQKISW